MTAGRERAGRRGLTLLEVVLAIVLVVIVLLALGNALGSSQRQIARMEDLVQFQDGAVRLLDAIARQDYGFVLRDLPVSAADPPAAATEEWNRWCAQRLGPLPAGMTVAAWRDGRPEWSGPHSTVVWTEARWVSHEASGRRIEYRTRLGRVLVRPEASLELEVPLQP